MSSIRETAESIVRRGLPYSIFDDEADYQQTKTWIVNEVEQALRDRDERAAKIVNNARFEDDFVDLRSLVSRIRTED